MKGTLLIFSLLIIRFGLAQPSSDPTAPISNSHYNSDNSPNVYMLNGRMGLQKNLHKPITPAVYDTLFMHNPTKYVGKRFNTTKQQSYWGIIDGSGHLVIPFDYRVVKISESTVIVGLAEHNLIKYGAFSIDGKEIISPIFESVEVLSAQLIAAKKESHTIVFNSAGIKLFQAEADSISYLEQDYLKVNINGKAGISRLNNDILLTNSYRDVKMVNNEVWIKRYPKWQIIRGYDTLKLNYDDVIDWQNCFIVASGGKSLLIDHQDKALSASYDSIIKVNKMLALIRNHNMWGVINKYGKEIITVNYSQIVFDDEVIYTRNPGKHGKWSLFDYYGFAKTKLKYDSVRLISDGRIAIERNGKWGYIDRFGIEVIAPIFDRVSQFNNGLAVVSLYGEDGIIDRTGKWIAAPSPINIQAYDNTTLLGMVNGQYQIKKFNGELVYFTGNRLEMKSTGFLEYDSSGVIIRKISWTGTYEYFNPENDIAMTGGAGLLIFKKNGKYGFKDQRGRIIIANQYEAAKPFHNRLAAIKINNRWGFINLDEQIVIQPRYDSVGHFIGPICITKKNSLYGVINLNGDEIVSNQYQHISPLGSGQLLVQKNSKWGILSEAGVVVVHPKYSGLYPVTHSFYIIERGGKYGTIDNTGVNKIPMLYDFIGYNKESKTMITKMVYKNEWAFLMKTHSINN